MANNISLANVELLDRLRGRIRQHVSAIELGVRASPSTSLAARQYSHAREWSDRIDQKIKFIERVILGDANEAIESLSAEVAAIGKLLCELSECNE